MSGPLDGYKILELTSTVSGPLAGMMLADQGAEVIKVEPVSTSEKFEIMEEKFVSRQDLEFSVWNRGKKSFALPYPGIRYANQADNTEFQSNLLKLISISEIFIENVDIKFGDAIEISYEMAKTVNPEIIYIKFTSFPENHPYEHLPSKEAVSYTHLTLPTILLV